MATALSNMGTSLLLVSTRRFEVDLLMDSELCVEPAENWDDDLEFQGQGQQNTQNTDGSRNKKNRNKNKSPPHSPHTPYPRRTRNPSSPSSPSKPRISMSTTSSQVTMEAEDWDLETPAPTPVHSRNSAHSYSNQQHQQQTRTWTEWTEAGPSTPTRRLVSSGSGSLRETEKTTTTENWDEDFEDRVDSPPRSPYSLGSPGSPTGKKRKDGNERRKSSTTTTTTRKTTTTENWDDELQLGDSPARSMRNRHPQHPIHQHSFNEMMKQTSTSTGQTKMKMIKLLLRGHVEPRYPGSCQTPPHRRRLRFHLYRFPFCPYRHSTLLLPTTTTNTYSLTLRLHLYSPSPRLIRAEQTDEDDNTDIEENEIEPDEQPKSILTAKLRCYSVDTPPSSFPPNTTVSDKSPITPSTTTAPATNSKAKASRGEADRPPASGIDEVGTLGVNIEIPPSKEDAMDIEVNVDDTTARNFKSKLTKVAAFKDETLEPEEGTSFADVSKVMLDPDPDPSDKSDAEPEPDVEVDVEPDVDAPFDVSDGEDEKEDDDDEGEGEDEKDDADELEVDEVQEDDDKDDEDKDDEEKEVSDKEDVEKDIDDDDRSEINLEDEEEEFDLQPVHRVEALDMLAIVELKFALLREKLYIEKMEELAWEESLVASGEHPELIFIQSELLSRKNKRLELSERKCTFEIANITKRRKIDEDATWSSRKHQRDELQTDMLAENHRKRRKLERERRAVDRPQTARGIPFPHFFDFLPPAPTLRQIVDSFPFANSDRIIRNHRHKSLRKTQSSKSQIQQNHFHGILHGINTHATPRGDLENLLSMTGARRSRPGSTQTNTMGMGMNLSVGNNGLNMDMNINLPIYEQGVHGPPVGLGHVYTPGAGTHNGSNPIRERLGRGSSSLNHGPGLARRMVSGPGTLSGSLSSQSTVGMGHVHEPSFVVGGLPPPPMGSGGGSESLLPSFGPSKSMGGVGPRSGSTAGLRSGSAGGGVDREREIRSVPSGSGGSGGRSSFHNGQSQHLFSDPSTTTNGAFPESEHQRDGDVVVPSSASSSVHGIHGRQVPSSTHFGRPGPGIGGGGPPPALSPWKRSISPIGPSVGIGLNSIKGNGQGMGPGMGMGGFGTGHRWEAEEHERELERTEHTDAGDIRGQDTDREQQQHARPQSAGALNAPCHIHSYPIRSSASSPSRPSASPSHRPPSWSFFHDSLLEYDEQQRDGRRMNGGRPSSGSGQRLLDERESERDRDRDRNQASTMPSVSGLNFQAHKGIAISLSASSSRPPSWNEIDRGLVHQSLIPILSASWMGVVDVDSATGAARGSLQNINLGQKPQTEADFDQLLSVHWSLATVLKFVKLQ
ncbi:hypothetical protein EV368DRAFT_87373 [Lentinula lateritia]|nr:hypothetical protein EV368DRAFT_87373 [Lentinula lateritia]